MLREAWMLAIEALSWMELRNLSEQHALTVTAKQLNLEESNALRLAYKMVYETTRKRNLIDKLIDITFAPKRLDDFDLGVQNFLRLYVYQVKFEKSNLADAAQIVNTGRHILDWQTLHEVEEVLGKLYGMRLEEVFVDLNDAEKTAYKTFHPSWYVKYCFRVFGRHFAMKLLEADNKPLPTYIRLNTLKGSEEALLKQIESDGILLEKELQLKHTYRVVKTETLLVKARSFTEGLFTIQDKASCFGVEATDPKPGTIVFDVCPSGGGKTTYLAQLMQNEGSIYSVVHSKQRIGLWKKELRRMGVDIAYPILTDVGSSSPFIALADVVILNPPCSRTGMFSKLPYIKWQMTSSFLKKLVERQWLVLNSYADIVREKGFLCYLTYSLTVEENEMLIERFLKWHPEFKLTDINPRIGLSGLRGLSQCQRLYPHVHGCNGLFIARLKKE